MLRNNCVAHRVNELVESGYGVDGSHTADDESLRHTVANAVGRHERGVLQVAVYGDDAYAVPHAVAEGHVVALGSVHHERIALAESPCPEELRLYGHLAVGVHIAYQVSRLEGSQPVVEPTHPVNLRSIYVLQLKGHGAILVYELDIVLALFHARSHILIEKSGRAILSAHFLRFGLGSEVLPQTVGIAHEEQSAHGV